MATPAAAPHVEAGGRSIDWIVIHPDCLQRDTLKRPETTKWCSLPDSNRHGSFLPRDFKSDIHRCITCVSLVYPIQKERIGKWRISAVFQRAKKRAKTTKKAREASLADH